MHIFNKQVFGIDAQNFLDKCCVAKKEWIKLNTNQQNDEIIDEFISSLPKSVEKEKGNCIGCGTLDDKIVRYGESISSGNVEASSTSEEQTISKPKGKRNSRKRQ